MEGLVSPGACLSVTCLPTEQGDFVVLELGATGASLRVLWVTLTGIEGHKVEPRSQEFVIPQEVMLGPGQQVSTQCIGSGPAWAAGAPVGRVKPPTPFHSSLTLPPAACLSSWMCCPWAIRVCSLGSASPSLVTRQAWTR